MRGFLTWCGALTIGFGGAALVASGAFGALDGSGVIDAMSTCGEILCDSDVAVFALTFAAWLALGAWLTAKARRWIQSRFSPPAP